MLSQNASSFQGQSQNHSASMPSNSTSQNKNLPAKREFDELGFIKRLLCPYCGSDSLKPSHRETLEPNFSNAKIAEITARNRKLKKDENLKKP
jgi:hypothetical protein